MAGLSSFVVDPVFQRERTYGPIKVDPSSMDDLAAGSYRLLSTSVASPAARGLVLQELQD